MLLRKRGQNPAFKLSMQWGSNQPQRSDSHRRSDSLDEIRSMLGNETSQLESDEETEKDDYFSDESEY